MSSTALVTIGQQEIQQGGQGLDFQSKLFQLKPATININQPNTQVEGAIAGNLRISETGDQFKEMFVTLLTMPKEARQFYTGEKGQMNRTLENLMCYSYDMIRPDAKAKVPQAMKCDGCPKSSWEKWRQTKLKEDIPPCDAHYYAVFIDTVYKMPLQMWVRSKSRAPFEAGMQNLARTFAKMRSQSQNPNIFDITFRLSTKPEKNGKFTSHVLVLDQFRAINEDERAAFGEVYLQYVNRGRQTPDQQAEKQASDQMDAASSVIDGELVEPGTVPSVEVNAQEITI